LTQAWSITVPIATQSDEPSYPLIAQGMVFLTTPRRTLLALNQGTGATIWSHPVGGNSTPGLAYDRGQVFASGASLLTAYDAATGSIAWTERLPGESSLGFPTAVNGIVYIGGGTTLYAVRESDGKVLWSYSGDPDLGFGFGPAVTADGVYVSSSAFDPLLGTLLWKQTSGIGAGGSDTPVVAGGHVLFHNVSLSSSTGAVEGSFPAGPAGYAYAIPALANGVAFTVTGQPRNNPTLNAVEGSGLGSTDWTFSGDGGLETAPIVAGGVVFEGSSSGEIYALDASTGSTSWSTSTGDAIMALAASNGTLIATDVQENGGVATGYQVIAYRPAGYITDAPSNQSPPTVDGSADLNEVKGADVGIWSGLPNAYAYQWEQCDDAGANCADISGATAPSYQPGPEAYGATLRVRVTATNGVGSSDPVESAASPELGLATAAPAFSTAAVVTGTATVGQPLSTTNGTWTNSATSYAYKWQRCDATGANCVDIAGATSSQYTPVESDVGSELRSEVLASNSIGSAPSGYAPSAATDVVVDSAAPALLSAQADEAAAYQLDATHDGYVANADLSAPLTQAWSVNLPAGEVGYPLIAQGMVFVTAKRLVNNQDVYTVFAFNQATGAMVWAKPTGGNNAEPVGLAYDRGRVFVADATSQGLTALDAATGAVAWNTQVPFQSLQSPPTATNGIVYSSSGALMYAFRETDGAILWTQPIVGGDNSAPAVTAQGVYVSYDCPQTYDFDPLVGTLLWHYGPDGCEGGGGQTPVVANGHVYVSDRIGGNVTLSPSTGAVQGSFNANHIPAFANGEAFMLADYTLSAIDASGFGDFAWSVPADSGNFAPTPIVAGDLVFEGGGVPGGNLYALDASTGATLWSTSAGWSNAAGDSDYIVASNGTLLAVEGRNLIAYRSAGTIGDPPTNQSQPSVEGPADLSGLEAADVGVWSGLPSAYSYQWESCDGAGANCADIVGATSASYLPPPGAVGVGVTLRVRVVATNGVGSSAPVESAPSASDPLVVVNSPSLRRQGSVVSGTPSVGQKVSTTNGIWINDPTSYAYKWQRCDAKGRNCADIAGATSPRYAVVSADKGHDLRSEVRARNAVGPAAGYVPSAPTKPVGLPWPGLLRSPIVSGTPIVGKVLATDTGAWTNTPTSYAYRWQRCNSAGANCVNIANATSSHYRLVLADVGHKIRSEVLARNAQGVAQTGYAPSAPTSVVAQKPVVTTLPKITGIATVGKSLSVTHGTWKYAPTGYAYQWFRCSSTGASCTPIAGASKSSYLLTSADAGHKLEAKVVASNAAGSVTATSNKSVVVKH
jgi:outer membrane protein assembly factor BamB